MVSGRSREALRKKCGQIRTVNPFLPRRRQCSVVTLRRQCSVSNRNIKRLVLLPIWIVKCKASSVDPSSEIQEEKGSLFHFNKTKQNSII